MCTCVILTHYVCACVSFVTLSTSHPHPKVATATSAPARVRVFPPRCSSTSPHAITVLVTPLPPTINVSYLMREWTIGVQVWGKKQMQAYTQPAGTCVTMPVAAEVSVCTAVSCVACMNTTVCKRRVPEEVSRVRCKLTAEARGEGAAAEVGERLHTAHGTSHVTRHTSAASDAHACSNQ